MHHREALQSEFAPNPGESPDAAKNKRKLQGVQEMNLIPAQIRHVGEVSSGVIIKQSTDLSTSLRFCRVENSKTARLYNFRRD
ncbi:unnamed protein product [Linum trigynum]|uniref:Uncharacterized protein n=1 Tax=Linum trigynum TaxID=586398 RepID=A0AAV2EZY3_9ROSI